MINNKMEIENSSASILTESSMMNLSNNYMQNEEIFNKNLFNDTVRINEIAEVLEGINITQNHFSEKGIRYIRPKDVVNWNINEFCTRVNEEFAHKYSDRLLRPGDILISKIFNCFNCSIVKEEQLPAIPSNNILVIRCNKFNGDVLFNALAFNEGKELFLKQVGDNRKGSTITYLNKKFVENINVILGFNLI